MSESIYEAASRPDFAREASGRMPEEYAAPGGRFGSYAEGRKKRLEAEAGDAEAAPQDADGAGALLEAVAADPKTLADMPAGMRTPDFEREAYRRNPAVYRWMSDEAKTERISLDAFGRDAENVRYMPRAHLTQAVCDEAVFQKPELFTALPEEFRSLKLERFYCLDRLSRTKDASFLRLASKELFTEDFCQRLVTLNVGALDVLPEERRTEAVYEHACGMHGCALERVPEDRRTEAVYAAAVKRNPESFLLVPEDRQTVEMYACTQESQSEELRQKAQEHASPVVKGMHFMQKAGTDAVDGMVKGLKMTFSDGFTGKLCGEASPKRPPMLRDESVEAGLFADAGSIAGSRPARSEEPELALQA